MRSGIGAPRQLAMHGVSVLTDLPGVGETLQDHPLAAVCCETRDSSPLHDSSNVAEAGLFVRTSILAGERAPDLQYHFLPALSPANAAKGIGGGVRLSACVLHQKIVDHVRLRSAAPDDFPVIHPNYLGENSDLDLMTEGIEIARAITRSKSLAPALGEKVLPGGSVRTREELHARRFAERQTSGRAGLVKRPHCSDCREKGVWLRGGGFRFQGIG